MAKTRGSTAGNLAQADGDGPMSRAVNRAYRAIRQGILRGDFKAGQKLPEIALAARIGVSRTPVREALGRLSAEGLVVLERYRKVYVAHHSERDIQEVFRLRAILEGHAAGRAATRISDADLDRLDAIQDAIEREYRRKGFPVYVEAFDALNAEFHLTIARAADSRRLHRMLAGSLELPGGLAPQYREPIDVRIRRTNWQHREIVAALRARNPSWAEAEMTAHLASFAAAGPAHPTASQADDQA